MSKKKTSRSAPVKGAIITFLIRIFAYIPIQISYLFSWLLSMLLYVFKSRGRQTTEINLKLCYSDLSPAKRQSLTWRSLIESGKLMVETARVWTRSVQTILSMVKTVESEGHLRKLSQQGEQGIILISPHIGNWEVLYTYLAYHFNAYGLYRPPKIIELDEMILKGREKAGGQMIRTSQMEVRKMLKVLKKGESIFMLPDQQPEPGSGVLAKFYGHEAYTMTLIQGLVKRTGAKLIMATCIREPQGFKINYRDIEINHELESIGYAEQLNEELKKEIDKNPEQYQWSYKRFKPSKMGDPDPYH